MILEYAILENLRIYCESLLTEKLLKENLGGVKIPKFRLKQIFRHFFHGEKRDFSSCFDIPKSLRNDISDIILEIQKKLPVVQKIIKSSDGTEKALFQTFDGKNFESVLIRQKKRNTVCLSTQIGCPVGCKFCATGALGFERNLESFEILSQVDFWSGENRKLQNKIDNIVFMGQGEPFLNFENLKDSVETLNSPFAYGFGARKITVSTVGIIPKIYEFSKVLRGQSNLAVSLHFPNQKLREKYIPVAKNYNLSDLIQSLLEYVKETNKKVFFEYVLLSGINTKSETLRELVSIMKKSHLFHLNLINYNYTGMEFKKAADQEILRIKNFLHKCRIPFTFRISFGEENFSACGQLGKIFDNKDV